MGKSRSKFVRVASFLIPKKLPKMLQTLRLFDVRRSDPAARGGSSELENGRLRLSALAALAKKHRDPTSGKPQGLCIKTSGARLHQVVGKALVESRSKERIYCSSSSKAPPPEPRKSSRKGCTFLR